MINRWKRKGNLFAARSYDDNDLSKYGIDFINDAACEIIKLISIEIDIYKKAYINIWVSPFFTEAINSIVSNIFDENAIIQIEDLELESFFHYVHTIAYVSNKTFKQINQFFLYINKNYKQEFSTEIIEEFKKLAVALPIFLNKLNETTIIDQPYQYAIPLAEEPRAFFNPDRDSSVALLKYIQSKSKHNFNLMEFIDLLKSGEDPNQQEPVSGISILMIVLDEFPSSALKTLIFYGANIFDKRNMSNENVMERCKRYSNDAPSPGCEIKYLKKLKILFNAINEQKISAALVNKMTAKERLQYVSISSSDESVKTLFYFGDDKLIITHLKPVEKLLDQERKNVQELFVNIFTVKNGGSSSALKVLAEDLIADERHWIELIWRNSQLVAVNLFEIIVREEIILHWIFSLRDMQEKLNQLPNLLGRRFAAALQWIYNDNTVWVQYAAIHYNGLRIMENDLYAPKYQTPQVMELQKINIDLIYDNEAKLEIGPGIICFGNEKNPLLIKNNATTKSKYLGEEFYNHMRGLNHESKDADAEGRFVPVLVPVGDDMLYKFEKIGSQIGLHTFSHLQLFTDHLLRVLPKDFNNKKTKSIFIGFADTRTLFFSQKRKIIKFAPSNAERRQDNFLSHI